MKNTLLLMLIAFIATAFVTSPESNKISEDDELDVKFRIQICVFENHIPYNKVEAMRKVGEVKIVKKEGWAYYYSKQYATEAMATSQLQYYYNVEFENAVEVAEINNQFYSIDDYHKMLKENKEPSIHIYK